MRKIFIYLVCVASLVLGGCDLNLEPENGVTFDHYFREEADCDALLRQLEADLRLIWCGVSFQEHMGILTDRIYNAASIEKVRNLDANYLTDYSNQQQWKPFYNVITNTHLLEENIDKVPLEAKRHSFYLGQIYFMRAACYFWLSRTWGDAVIVKNSSYIDRYSKCPATEVIDTAIANAKRAYRLLPRFDKLRDLNNKALSSKQYGSKGSAAALLAHIYAWKGSVQKNNDDLRTSIDWASRLIEPQYQDSVGVYTLAESAEEVATSVMDRNSAEGIFEIEINYADISYYGSFFPGSYFISYPVLRNSGKNDITTVTYGLYRSTVLDMYEEDDERREAFFYALDSTDMNTADLTYLYKWRTPQYESSGSSIEFKGMDCNRILIRLADIYLLRAECEAKLGMTAQAQNDLNAIRERRGATPFPGGINDNGGSDLQYSIFLERERELLFEGHRYYDAVRNGYYGQNSRYRVLPDAFYDLTDQDISEGALYLPVPQTAFNDNDLMIQNAYWISKMR